MGLFSKKTCDICGGDIGLLGNKKLEDGNLCKNCAKKLSPWFSERRHSTVREIGQQLAYREMNLGRVAAFTCTRVLGTGYKKLYLDENHGTFAVCTESEWKGGNPDIIDADCLVSAKTDIRESHYELHDEPAKEPQPAPHGSQGHAPQPAPGHAPQPAPHAPKQPPRFHYHYDVDMVIKVQSPWFDELRFDVTGKVLDDEDRPGPHGRVDMERNPDYREAVDTAADMEEALASLQNRQAAAAQAAAAQAAALQAAAQAATTVQTAGPKFCSNCGAALTAGARFCSGCGQKIG